MSTRTETHRLDLGALGCAVVRLTFSANEIAAALDAPLNLNRKNRRLLPRWIHRNFHKLDADPRGMRVVTTSSGRTVSIGSEYHGNVGVVFP